MSGKMKNKLADHLKLSAMQVNKSVIEAKLA